MGRPDLNQYINTIKGGDDKRNKNIVLNFDGSFSVCYDYSIEDKMKYVGKSEILGAGNGYVGESASKDLKNYIEPSYAMFLEAWIKFITKGSKGQYLDLYPPKSYKDFEKDIDNL